MLEKKMTETEDFIFLSHDLPFYEFKNREEIRFRQIGQEAPRR